MTAFADDSYEHLSGETRASVRIQRSEFIGIAFPAPDEVVFQARLEAVRKEMFDATHHCWAFRFLAQETIVEKSADAGEPSGTAGRPILQAIEDAGLLDTGVIVVRYYGGVKLGTGGLARAYRDGAREALATAPRVRKYLYETLECAPGYDKMSQIYRMISPPDILLAEERYDPEPKLTLHVRRNMVDAIRTELREQRIALIE